MNPAVSQLVMWVMLGLVAWLTVGGSVAVLIGRVIRRADRGYETCQRRRHPACRQITVRAR